MTMRARSIIASSMLLPWLAPASRAEAQSAPSATEAARIVGDYVLQGKRDGMPHTVRVGYSGERFSVQWDANTPTTLLPRPGGSFRILADTTTTIAFSAEPDAAHTLLMISARGDTVRAPRVASAPPGTGFDGDDWPAARGGSLFDSLAVADSLLFDAFFVRCDAEATIAMYSSDAEFYHDQSGLKVGAAAMDAFRSNCPRDKGVRRVIVPGSVRVFGIAGYGAVQLGRHRFVQSDGTSDVEAKFIQLWQRTSVGWRATRTISVDHRRLPGPPR
jgi:Domain of unknown function (DUF4440)